jgi:hypothetical protein
VKRTLCLLKTELLYDAPPSFGATLRPSMTMSLVSCCMGLLDVRGADSVQAEAIPWQSSTFAGSAVSPRAAWPAGSVPTQRTGAGVPSPASATGCFRIGLAYGSCDDIFPRVTDAPAPRVLSIRVVGWVGRHAK